MENLTPNTLAPFEETNPSITGSKWKKMTSETTELFCNKNN